PQAGAAEQPDVGQEVVATAPLRQPAERPVTAWSKTRPPVAATVAWAKATPNPEQKAPPNVAAPQVLQPCSAAELRAQLLEVPEVSLAEEIPDEAPKDSPKPGPRAQQITAARKQIHEQVTDIAQLS